MGSVFRTGPKPDQEGGVDMNLSGLSLLLIDPLDPLLIPLD